MLQKTEQSWQVTPKALLKQYELIFQVSNQMI